jgi:protein SCO1/2
VDDRGNAVQLNDYLGRAPVLMILGYYTCPGLCSLAFEHLAEELNGVAPMPGRDFQVVIVSFDPRDTPAAAADQKAACLRAYKWPAQANAWHFLTGNRDSIDAVTTAVGFHYVFDSNQQQFLHPTGLLVLTPEGKISHCFSGIDAAPEALQSAIHDAAAGNTPRVDHAEQEYCVIYDPTLSPHGRFVMRAIQTTCISWAAILFAYMGYKFAGDTRRRGGRGES